MELLIFAGFLASQMALVAVVDGYDTDDGGKALRFWVLWLPFTVAGVLLGVGVAKLFGG